MSVLIISNSDNEHANQVEKTLSEFGVTTTRLNFDRVLMNRDTIFVSSSGITIRGGPLSLETITGVFIHHPKITIPEGSGIDDLDREITVQSWKNALDWLEAALPTATWINRLSASRNAISPLLQTSVARQVCFDTPASCYTNDVNLLRTFAEQHEKIVLKSGPIALNRPKKRILTHLVDPWSIEVNQLVGAPCFFQEYVEKAFELRVHVIGKEVYACKIESQANENTKTDWRNYDIPNTPHYPFELESAIADQCVALTKKLGLTAGIIDLIVKPDSQFIFLECNSQGHWIWIEELTKLPITDAICHLLVA